MGNRNEPLTGFEWKSGTARTTRGLIFWPDVFLYNDVKTGDKYAIYVLDTQGLFDHSTSSNDNARIFSLSTLISSVQIMNVFNLLQEDQLNYLQFATAYAKYASDDSQPFQNLLLLIRDWNSPGDYAFGLKGGNEYLNDFLEVRENQHEDLKQVRRYVRSSFERINCFLMPHPGRSVARNSSYDGRFSEIDVDFVKGLSELFEHLLSPKKLVAKTINGVEVNPAELLLFMDNYINSFATTTCPMP